MNAAARLIYSSSRFGHITPLLKRLHWLKAKERIDVKVAVLVYKCLHGTAPTYLADELSRSAEVQGRSRLRSASSSQLVVRRTTRYLSIGYLSCCNSTGHWSACYVQVGDDGLPLACRNCTDLPVRWVSPYIICWSAQISAQLTPGHVYLAVHTMVTVFAVLPLPVLVCGTVCRCSFENQTFHSMF